MKTLEKRMKWRTDPLEIKVENQFQLFITKFLNSKNDEEYANEIAA